MKGALLKKRCGVPVAFLLVLLLCGTALAWYCFATIESETKVNGPLSVEDEEEFSEEMCPGQTNTWSFEIVNSADVSYSVKADLTYDAPSGVTITSFTVGNADETSDLKDDNSATFDIDANETVSCSMTISATNDATPGTVEVSLDLSRG